MKYWQDSHRTLYQGDCRSMAEIPDEAVQCVITSPPYWGLRKYAGLPDLIWGGREDCQHIEMIPSPEPSVPKAGNKQRDYIEDGQYTGKHKWQHDSIRFLQTGGVSEKQGSNKGVTGEGWIASSSFCSVCGAWKGQLGLEPTADCGRPYLKLKSYFGLDQRRDLCNSCYICHTIQILREIRRVLRKDGVVFWNIGDSYFATGYGKGTGNFSLRDIAVKPKVCTKDDILKPKDLCLIPFRLAIALQEDGWWVRSVIIWNKTNPMPESVRDRPTESHEYILMLTKSARYYYDQEAVREPSIDPESLTGRRWRSYSRNDYSKAGLSGELANSNPTKDVGAIYLGRNLRSVWTFPTQSYPEAHFATYPEELVRRCVLAATPEVGCCSKCGKPWVRIIERKVNTDKPSRVYKADTEWMHQGEGSFTLGQTEYLETKTIGWKAQCSCGLPQSENIGSIVLDPFTGSGTTLKVAAELNRHAIGYELSEQYCKLAVDRNRQEILL